MDHGTWELKLLVALIKPMPTRLLVKVVLDMYPKRRRGENVKAEIGLLFRKLTLKGAVKWGSSWGVVLFWRDI